MIQQMKAEIIKLKRDMAAMRNLSIEGYNKTSSRGGMAFSIGSRDVVTHDAWPLTVAIIRTPVAGDTSLRVREVGYKNIPPKKCEGSGDSKVCYYAWFGIDFTVYPPMGKEAVEYAGDEQTLADEDHPPTLTTKFHRIHREREVWVMDLEPEGGASIEFVRIRGSAPYERSPEPTSRFLSIQRMKADNDPNSFEFGEWVPVGEPEVAECWPEYVAAHYLPMVNMSPQLIVPMTKVNGTQYVWQKNRMFLGQPLSSLPQSDCVVPLRP